LSTTQDVLSAMATTGIDSKTVATDRLNNTFNGSIDLTPAEVRPAVASIYQLDGMVRRSGSLQLTADARAAQEVAA